MKTIGNLKPTTAATKAVTIATLMSGTAPVGIVAEADTQVATITRELRGAFDALIKPANDAVLAKEDADKAKDGELGVRTTLLVRLANASAKHNLAAKHFDDEKAFAKMVREIVAKWSVDTGSNHTPASIAQFGVECRRAMHPSARDHISTCISATGPAWKAEVAATTKARNENNALIADGKKPNPMPPAPLKDTFAKEYHLLAGSKGMLQAHIEGLPEASDPHALAEVREVATHSDEQLAARRMKSLANTLATIYADFPADQIKRMFDLATALGNKPEVLAKARKDALAAQGVNEADDALAQAEAGMATAEVPAAIPVPTGKTPKLVKPGKAPVVVSQAATNAAIDAIAG